MDNKEKMGNSRIDCVNTAISRVYSGILNNETERDWVAQETPIALEYNGINYVTMLATPSYLEDFALGFSLSEGIIRDTHEMLDIEFQEGDSGIVMQIQVTESCAFSLKKKKRFMLGKTGCGLCGIDTLQSIASLPIKTINSHASISIESILQSMKNMRNHQHLHNLTGGTHAAGWANSSGKICLVREDVGRHNALDKLIGGLIKQGVKANTGMILISSRASFEMVQKTISSGCGILAAISAPTAKAIELARNSNVVLLGFLRKEDAAIYTHSEHLRF